MAHNVNANGKPTIIGAPIYNVTGDEVRLVEGKLGNPVFVNDDDVFDKQTSNPWGGDFYLLVTAEKGKEAAEVGRLLAGQHYLLVRPFVPFGEAKKPDEPAFELKINPDKSYHYLDDEVAGELHFKPDNVHLRALFGENADYFMINVQLPNDRESLFGKKFRKVADSENINVRKFDLIQQSTDGVVEVMHRGGLAVFDRQDLEGKPDLFYGVTLSDLHLSSENDKIEKVILTDPEQRGLFLKFNNANANLLEAIIPWLNREYDAGRLDWVQVLGDNVDYAGQNNEIAGNVSESNFNILARALNRIKPPVFVLLGNHDVLPEAFPPTLTAQNFNLKGKEVGKLVDSKSFIKSISDSIMNDDNSLLTYHDLVNPFHDTVVDFGKGEEGAREFRLVLTDTGGGDWAHFRHDDPVYSELQFWPWNLPYLHVVTLKETFLQESPDVRGSLPDQISWLSRELAKPANIVLLSHAPLLNSKKGQLPYQPDNPVTPVAPAGAYEDLTFNTTAHGRELVQLVADSPSVILQMGGHTHSDGHAYLMGVDYQNHPQFYRGPVREVLDDLNPENFEEVHHFWNPEHPCEGNCSPQIDALYGSTATELRNKKFVWQVGSAAVYNDGGETPPSLTRMTVTPEGLIGGEEHFYVVKKLVEDSEETGLYGLELSIDSDPLHNDRLDEEWEKIVSEKPSSAIDWKEAEEKLEERTRSEESSYIPHPDSLNDYPRYVDGVEHPFISPTRLNSHLRLKAYGQLYQSDEAFVDWRATSLGLGVQYFFSENQIGTVPRILLLQGAEGGVIKDQKGAQVYAAYQTPPFIDWHGFKRVTLRAGSFSLGPGFRFYPEPAFYFHDHVNLAELEIDLKRNSQEKGGSFLLGLDRHNLFSGKEGEWLWYGGINFTY